MAQIQNKEAIMAQQHELNVTPLKASQTQNKQKFLRDQIKHIDITTMQGIVPLVESMQHLAFSSRDLWRASDIYDRMLRDPACAVFLTLAGSLVSAGMKKIFVDLIRNNMVDAIVATGA